MEWQVCNQCGTNKEAIRDNYEFRNDNNKFRTVCKTCSNDNDLRERYIEKCADAGIDKDSITEYEPKIFRICLECKQRKYSLLFSGNRNDGFCDKCRKLKRKEAQIKFKERHPERAKELRKKSYDKNREKRLEEGRKRRSTPEGKEKERIRHAKRRKNNPNWDRRKRDPFARLRNLVSTSVRCALGSRGYKKTSSTFQHLPYNFSDLRKHIESQFEWWMNWNNQGIYNQKTWDDNDPATWTWQLDHIIPHSEFHYTTMDCQEFRDCWALSNLRPLSAKQNILEGTRKTRHKILNTIGNENALFCP